tara:strand:- start:1288 stop:1695 length:408 start_codon:yes stop_codon:yes gene_type:complete
MKKIVFLLVFMVLNAQTGFAAEPHKHPMASQPEKLQNAKTNYWPGSCEININNQSYDPITVYGLFDDGQSITFNIFPGEPPHAISLFYYGACHYEMFINITTFNGYNIYSNYTAVDSKIEVWPGYFRGYKAVLKK